MRPTLILHELGDPAGGGPWREAFLAAGFEDVVSPDLPGHRGQGAPRGGNYTMTEAGFAVARLLGDGLSLDQAIVVGVGQSGWSAQILAMVGRAGCLVLVDGLGGPWTDPRERALQRRRRNRAIVSDPNASSPYEGDGLDPRLRHGVPPHGSADLAMRAARLTEVPTLVLESTPVASGGLVEAFPAGCSLATVDPTPRPVAQAVAAWARQWPGRTPATSG